MAASSSSKLDVLSCAEQLLRASRGNGKSQEDTSMTLYWVALSDSIIVVQAYHAKQALGLAWQQWAPSPGEPALPVPRPKILAAIPLGSGPRVLGVADERANRPRSSGR
jgi:hypothetical protein